MTCRDRTGDFNLAIRSLHPHHVNGMVPPKQDVKVLVNMGGNFMSFAKQVSKDLANTFVKLEKLTLLAQKKSLFDDKSDEIQKLTLVIKQDINQLNEQISQLRQVSRGQGSLRGENKQSHTNSVVCTLQSHLAKMSNDFKCVLETRTKNMKNQKMRKDQFSSSSDVTLSLPTAATNGRMGSVLLQDELLSQNFQQEPHTYVNMEGGSMATQQMALIQEQDNYIQSRADTMVNIEQTIVELGTIFQQLAHMVHEQDEIVHRIDSNIEESSLNIEAAHSELVRYFQSVTSNRWLMVKVFAILIIFFIIFIVFVA